MWWLGAALTMSTMWMHRGPSQQPPGAGHDRGFESGPGGALALEAPAEGGAASKLGLGT